MVAVEDDATDADGQQTARRRTLAGIDFLGRDIYTRLLLAGRISLIIGLLTMLLSVTLGYLLGASGYVGGLTDKLIMRLADLVHDPQFAFINRRRRDTELDFRRIPASGWW